MQSIIILAMLTTNLAGAVALWGLRELERLKAQDAELQQEIERTKTLAP